MDRPAPIPPPPDGVDGVRRTIWLTRPDLRALCRDDWTRFEWWLALSGGREYRGLVPLAGRPPPMEGLDQPAEEALPGVQPPLTRLMALVWSLRPDLQATFDLGTPRGQQGFVGWLLTHGARESPILAEVSLAAARDLLDAPAAAALPGPVPPLTRFMTVVWAMRPDLQEAFDLGTARGQQGFVWWYFVQGMAELGLARYLTAGQTAFLNAPAPEIPGAADVPVTRLMLHVWSLRADLQRLFPLPSPEGCERLAAWWFTRGMEEAGLLGLVDGSQARLLWAPSARRSGIPRILAMLWSADPALRQRFPDPANPGMEAWARGEGCRSHAILERLAALAAPPPPSPPRGSGIRRDPRPAGVNLVGFARAQFGIGEDVRMAAQAMRAAGIPFCVHNVDPGGHVCQGDDSVAALLRDDLPYAVTLLCMNGFEAARLAAVEGGRLFDGRRTIGHWQWELGSWPEAWHHVYDLVDEVWAPSRHTYGAYTAGSPKPVRHVPVAVTLSPTAGLGRAGFGLPDGRFLFVFSFDTLSGVARKNPQACVRAFRHAFPCGDEPVGLVVKAMRGAAGKRLWEELLDDARTDPRILVIDRTLDRAEVLDLYRSCDAFLSLHRAEGFGRGIAEAMLLGKPVVVTGHSGNMDFTTPGTAALVDHRMRPVGPGEYEHAEGLAWAEPDVEHAAWWMRRLVGDADLRARLADQGRRLVEASYAPAVIGRHCAALLGLGA